MGYSNVAGIHQLPSSSTRINRRLHHLLRSFVICYHRAINRVLGLGSDAELVLGMFAPPNESFFFFFLLVSLRLRWFQITATDYHCNPINLSLEVCLENSSTFPTAIRLNFNPYLPQMVNCTERCSVLSRF